ncbi:MAG TPA: universal stress protein, partial [Agitococcus sp.]|nr:universal stress protein [Agitococcus sp.]
RKLIPALSHNLAIDLVVMGSVARTGIAGLIIGNTAETILEQLQCSVLVLKPQGFISPVTLVD